MDDDAFWNVELEYGNKDKDDREETWLAPFDRGEEEALLRLTKNKNNDEIEKEENYQWQRFVLLFEQKQELDNCNKPIVVSIRCRQVDTCLSHVGEELWDASKIFVSWLLQSSNNNNDGNNNIIHEKRVLELGSGCGLLGMAVSTLGAKHVLCTDFLPDVLENLAFNIQHNGTNNSQQCGDCNHRCLETKKPINKNNNSSISVAYLDWTTFTRSDLSNVDWLEDNDAIDNGNEDEDGDVAWKRIAESGETNVSFPGTVREYPADVIIGSALIYSPQGIPCADTIHHYFINCGTKDAWILQLTDRPGFRRFVLRIERLGHTCQLHPISQSTFDMASDLLIGANPKITSPREAFKLLHIIPNPSLS